MAGVSWVYRVGQCYLCLLTVSTHSYIYTHIYIAYLYIYYINKYHIYYYLFHMGCLECARPGATKQHLLRPSQDCISTVLL